jgi:DNA-binding transcriptional MerR regulator
MFGVSIETIRTWALEYEGYLSPNANPGGKKRRQYNEDDLKVLALVHDLRDRNFSYHDIQMSLDKGQRGSITLPLPEDAESLALATRDQLFAEVKQLRYEIKRLSQELEEARAYRDQALTLKAQLDAVQNQLDKTETDLKETHETIQELSKEAGQQYARGYTNGIDYERGQSND